MTDTNLKAGDDRKSAAPAEPSGDRPHVTFAVFAYNQERYIREAIDGAFAQTYTPLEIILSDDCSTDRTFEIMQEMAAAYRGPHRVILRKNPRNLGISAHIETVFSLACGDLLVLAAGDDISRPERTTANVEAWTERGKPRAVIYSEFVGIDENGVAVQTDEQSRPPSRNPILDFAMGKIGILGAVTAYTKDVLANFPSISTNVMHEDRVLPYRIILNGGQIIFISKQIVLYRLCGGISRLQFKDARSYFSDMLRPTLIRTLADAVQREIDTSHASKKSPYLEALCKRTVRTQECAISLLSPRSSLEASLFRGILRGARLAPSASLYLKLRFKRLFELYFSVRWIQIKRTREETRR